MKLFCTRQGMIVQPEGTPDELYLETVIAAGGRGAIVGHRPIKDAWGQLEIRPAPPPPVVAAPVEPPKARKPRTKKPEPLPEA